VRDKKKGVLVQKVFVPVNTTSFAFVSCRRCVSHATSYRAERWFGFSFVTFVIVGNGGRPLWINDGYRRSEKSVSVGSRGELSEIGVILRRSIARVHRAGANAGDLQDAHGGSSKRCEDTGEQGVQTRAIKV
jgi:hypothetical protein